MGKLFRLFSSRKSYCFALPIASLSVASAYGIWTNLSISSPVEHNYLARVQLAHGEIDNPKEKIDETRRRLSDFYRKYGSNNVGVNISKKTEDNQSHSDLFIHFRSSKKTSNPNRLWFDNVHLNQFSIDRYGREFDASTGSPKSGTSAKVRPIVKWSDVSLDNTFLESSPSRHISFNLQNSDIPKEEVEILMNEDESKFKTETGESNDWFVWMDKDILALKLNYILQTFVFDAAKGESQITSIVGNDSSRQGTQKEKYDQLQENLKNLTNEEKEFAKNYILTFLDNSVTDLLQTTKWNSIVTNTVTQSYFITPQDLNKIFNTFTTAGKSTSLFKPHLITKISSGKSGGWKKSLNLSGSEKDKTKQEARKISRLTPQSSDEEKDKNKVKLFVDPSVNPELKLNEIFDWITKYSVKHFFLRTKGENDQNIVVSSTYSPSDKGSELLHILQMEKKNEFGLSRIHIVSSALGLFFLISVAFYIIKTFRAPGGIFMANVAAGISCVGGVFFFLGSSLSLVGVAAMMVGVLYALFLSYYILSFLKRLFAIEFLDKDNTFVVFKRGLIFATDTSFPIFITSSLISFLAPLDLREFGIVLSLCVMFFFPFISLFSTLMALGHVNAKFLKIGNFYRNSPISRGVFLNKMCAPLDNKTILFTGLGFLGFCIISLSMFLTLGFNSFSFLRQNDLLLVKNSQDSIPQGFKQIGDSGALKAFLGNVGASLPDSLKEYSLQLTDSYSDFYTLRDLMWVFSFIFLFVLLYALVRFGIKGAIVLFLNSLFSLLCLFAIFIVFRVSIGSGIFAGLCSWISFLIFYNVLFLGREKNERMEWFARISDGIFSDIFRVMRTTIFLFLGLGLMTMNEEMIMMNIYISTALLLSHYFSSFVYNLLSNSLRRIGGRYIRRSEDGWEEMENLDEYDEELIYGINVE